MSRLCYPSNASTKTSCTFHLTTAFLSSQPSVSAPPPWQHSNSEPTQLMSIDETLHCPAAPFNPHDHKSACIACDRLWALYMKIALTNNALQLVMKAKDQSWRSMSGHRIRDRDCFHAYDPIRDEDLQEILFISECETQHIDTGWLEVKKKMFFKRRWGQLKNGQRTKWLLVSVNCEMLWPIAEVKG